MDDCGLTSVQLAKNKERVRELCAEIKSQGKAKHLDIDNITVSPSNFIKANGTVKLVVENSKFVYGCVDILTVELFSYSSSNALLWLRPAE